MKVPALLNVAAFISRMPLLNQLTVPLFWKVRASAPLISPIVPVLERIVVPPPLIVPPSHERLLLTVTVPLPAIAPRKDNAKLETVIGEAPRLAVPALMLTFA